MESRILTNLTVPRDEAEEKIASRIADGEKLFEFPLTDFEKLDEAKAEYEKWNDFNKLLIQTLFDTNEVLDEYDDPAISFSLTEFSFFELTTNFKGQLRDSITTLESIKERLTLYPVDVQIHKHEKPTGTTTAEGHYDIAQICIHGHVIEDAIVEFPECKKDFCDKCGGKTITNCPNCEAEIQGHYFLPGDTGGHEYTPPRFCHACSKAFPWTAIRLEAAHELAKELEDISDDEKHTLQQSIDEIVRETPKTGLAAVRLKKILAKTTSAVAKPLKDIIVEIASEAAKKQLGI